MEVVAHRGLTSTVPENSLAAISAAMTAGLDLIEVDVRATADGALFLLHDKTLERTTNLAGPLAALTAAQAAQARLADGSPLPRLEEALSLCEGCGRLCLDVKTEAAIAPLLRCLRGYEATLEVWSLHLSVVRHAAAAGLRAALISSGFMRLGIGRLIWTAQEAGAAALSFYPADLEPHVAAACRNAGMPFLCGTPNDEPTWRRLAAAGARAIITDRPLPCRSVLAVGSPVCSLPLRDGDMDPYHVSKPEGNAIASSSRTLHCRSRHR